MINQLEQLGFLYNPFQYRESSNDPKLVDHMVNYETFALAWANEPGLILAGAGAGKTAMRIYTAYICWTHSGRRHPFPIPYYLPHHFDHPTFFSLPDHLSGILRAGAASLLLGLAYRPEILLIAPPAVQQRTARLLDHYLPSPLARYLGILREELNVRALPPLLDRAYILPAAPNPDLLLSLCAALQQPASQAGWDNPQAAFGELVDLLQTGFGFRSIFVLLDGIDAYDALSHDAGLSCQALAPLFAEILPWSEKGIYFKGFLPVELEPALQHAFPGLMAQMNMQTIAWDTDRLAAMLRRRISLATQNKFGSLDALANPALRDVETQLARACPPLPRHLIIFTENVLNAAWQRSAPGAFQITPEDISAALQPTFAAALVG